MAIFNQDDQTAIDLLRKIVRGTGDEEYHGYVNVQKGLGFLTLDLTVSVTHEEADLISRLME